MYDKPLCLARISGRGYVFCSLFRLSYVASCFAGMERELAVLILSCESDFWTMTFCLASPRRLLLQRYAFFGKRGLFASQFYLQIVEAIDRVYLQASFLVFRSAKK